jgi:TonB family protein
MKRSEFRVTICNDTNLLQRLIRELRFVGRQLRAAWPELKHDPVGFSREACNAGREQLRRTLAAPNALTALATAMLVVLSAVLMLVLGDMGSEKTAQVRSGEEPAQIVEFVPDLNVKPAGQGVGAGSNGRVGFAKGRGEGSAHEPKKSTGGGGSGNDNPLPAPHGHLPPPSQIPAPIPKFPPVQKQTLATAGIDIDPVLWQNLPVAGYGDPRSQATAASNGPGSGAGMGNGNGTGVGDGSGAGVGPGRDGNIGGGPKGIGNGGIGGSSGNSVDDTDRVYSALLVSERARVLAKPEPQYTEDARRNQITGAVVLRVVFSRTGEVTNIRAIHALPFGLTEKAIAAARMIRFRPAIKEGRPVNVYMQLEYNFNLY